MPTNYNPSIHTPVIFHYHDAGDKPNSELLKTYTKGQDYILIGMTYAVDETQEPISQEQAKVNLQTEVKMFRKVLAWLPKKCNVDGRRVYLAGTGKGGWTASAIADHEIENLAGLIILMAGRRWLQPPPVNGAAFKDKKIYIGIGEDDPNNLHGHWAKIQYRKLGARTCFDEFRGLGRSIPSDSKLLTGWLKAYGSFDTIEKNEVSQINQWLNAEIAEVKKEKDVLNRYYLLHSLRSNPMTQLCSKKNLAVANKLWSGLSGDPKVGPEWKSEVIFNRTLALEHTWVFGKRRTSAGLTAAYNNYKQVAKVFPGTRYGALASVATARLGKTITAIPAPAAR